MKNKLKIILIFIITVLIYKTYEYNRNINYIEENILMISDLNTELCIISSKSKDLSKLKKYIVSCGISSNEISVLVDEKTKNYKIYMYGYDKKDNHLKNPINSIGWDALSFTDTIKSAKDFKELSSERKKKYFKDFTLWTYITKGSPDIIIYDSTDVPCKNWKHGELH